MIEDSTPSALLALHRELVQLPGAVAEKKLK